MADILLHKRLLLPERRQGYCCRDDWTPAARRCLQLRHRYQDAIHAPVEDALAVLLCWHGAGGGERRKGGRRRRGGDAGGGRCDCWRDHDGRGRLGPGGGAVVK